MPSKVPLWVVESLFTPCGHALDKRPPMIRKDAKNCKECDTWLPEYKDECWWQGESYCKVCYEEVRKKYFAHMRALPPSQGSYFNRMFQRDTGEGDEEALPLYRAGSRNRKTLADVPKGNLSITEYRWWVGEKNSGSRRALCRACSSEITGNIDNRSAHWADQRYWREGKACTVQLTDAFKVLLKKQKCLVCECYSTQQKWGVPLCGIDCIETWMFDDAKGYLPLVFEVAQVGTTITKVAVLPRAEGGVYEGT